MQVILTSLFVIIQTTLSVKEVIGYYPSWKWNDRSNLADPQNLDFSKVSIINFAFFETDIHGNLYVTDPERDPRILFGPIVLDKEQSNDTQMRCSHNAPGETRCNYHLFNQGLISLVHQQQAAILPSIGGSSSSNIFPIVAASDSARKHFAQECVELIKDYDFDGIDLNWRYPNADDKQNLFLLLHEIRLALTTYTKTTNKYYQLTGALPCDSIHIARMDMAYYVTYIHMMLDQIHLMTYDSDTSDNQVTAVYAPISDIQSCVQRWVSHGADTTKMNIALPFHGRSYRNANGLQQAHDGIDRIHWNEDGGMPQYYNIVNKLSEMISVRDDERKTQYAYLYDNSGMISYDDPVAICNKVQYVLDNDLNGLVIWDIMGDVMKDLSTPLLDEINLKLMFPDEHKCGGFGPDPTPHPTSYPTIYTERKAQKTSVVTVDNARDCVYTEEYVQALLLEIRHLEQILEQYNDGCYQFWEAST